MHCRRNASKYNYCRDAKNRVNKTPTCITSHTLDVGMLHWFYQSPLLANQPSIIPNSPSVWPLPSHRCGPHPPTNQHRSAAPTDRRNILHDHYSNVQKYFQFYLPCVFSFSRTHGIAAWILSTRPATSFWRGFGVREPNSAIRSNSRICAVFKQGAALVCIVVGRGGRAFCHPSFSSLLLP